MIYKVSKTTSSSNRIITSRTWRNKSLAQRFADETNMYSSGARARVVKVRKPRKK